MITMSKKDKIVYAEDDINLDKSLLTPGQVIAIGAGVALAGAGAYGVYKYVNNLEEENQANSDYLQGQRDNATANASAASSALVYTQGQLANATNNNSILTQQIADMGIQVNYLTNLLDVTNDNYANIYNLLNETTQKFKDIYSYYNITKENWGVSNQTYQDMMDDLNQTHVQDMSDLNQTHLQEMDSLYQQFQDLMSQQNITHSQALADLNGLWQNLSATWNMTAYDNAQSLLLDDMPTLDDLYYSLEDEEKLMIMDPTQYADIRQIGGIDIEKAKIEIPRNTSGDYLINMDSKFTWYLIDESGAKFERIAQIDTDLALKMLDYLG